MAESRKAASTVSSSGRTTRHPWIAYGACALLLSTSLVVLLTSPPKQGALLASPEFTEAVDFFVRNPEVEVSDRLAQLIGRDVVLDARTVHEAKRVGGGVAVLSERMQSKSQAKFDALERAALASLDDLPNWRFGVRQGSPVTNWFMHLTVHETALSLGVSMVFLTLAAIVLEGAWGTRVFGCFFLLLPFVPVAAHRIFYPHAVSPWAGPSALIAALLGAYFVRSFRGFVIPGWLVVPVWIVAEYLLARDISLSDFDTTPVVMHSIGFGFGVATALAVGASGLEAAFEGKDNDSPVLVSNPTLEQALQAREEGNPEAAFALLDQELSRAPANHDVAVAFWDVARRLDRCERALPTMLGAVRACLRAGMRDHGTILWNTLMLDVRNPNAESTLLVRVGESLIAEGQAAAGVRAFALALAAPRRLSSILAIRVVRAAQTLDPDLAGSAAAIALIDPQLDPLERRQLKAFVERVEAGDARVRKDRRAEPRRRSEVEAALRPKVRVAEIAAQTQVPDGAATEVVLAPTIDRLTADLQRSLFAEGSVDLDPYQDPNAIAADQFVDVPAPPTDRAEEANWNQPGAIKDLSSELEDLAPAVDEEAGFDWEGLNEDFASDIAEVAEAAEAAEAAESAVSAVSAVSVVSVVSAVSAESDESAADAENRSQAPRVARASPAPISTTSGARASSTEAKEATETTETTEVSETTETLDVHSPRDQAAAGATPGIEGGGAFARRTLAIRIAVPVKCDETGISCEVEGGGKTTLPFDRIDAVAVAAVAGLSDKPVIVIDLALNWMDVPDAPLKIIRLRSDGFDPRRLKGGASAIEALRALLEHVLAASGATPLPSAHAARGNPFENHPSLESYQQAVLMAELP